MLSRVAFWKSNMVSWFQLFKILIPRESMVEYQTNTSAVVGPLGSVNIQPRIWPREVAVRCFVAKSWEVAMKFLNEASFGGRLDAAPAHPGAPSAVSNLQSRINYCCTRMFDELIWIMTYEYIYIYTWTSKRAEIKGCFGQWPCF